MARMHAPVGWDCQFCQIARGEEIDGPWVKHSDIVYRDADLTAFISPHWWPNNPGHVVIIPNEHHENLYVVPNHLLCAVAVLSKRMALALIEAYGCAGTSVRQHNEPAGGQDVWHYHLHVFPRYAEDGLYESQPALTTPEQRFPYAERVREALDATTYRRRGFGPLFLIQSIVPVRWRASNRLSARS